MLWMQGQGEEEQPQGVEMDGDFDGEMFDIPDNQDAGNNSSGDEGDEEELQREMGDDAGDGQEV